MGIERFQYGYGVVDGCSLVKKLVPDVKPDICKRYPWLCDRRWWYLCWRYPWLCRGLRMGPRDRWTAPVPPYAGPELEAILRQVGDTSPEQLEELFELVVPEAEAGELSSEQLAYMVGFLLGLQQEAAMRPEREDDGECKDE